MFASALVGNHMVGVSKSILAFVSAAFLVILISSFHAACLLFCHSQQADIAIVMTEVMGNTVISFSGSVTLGFQSSPNNALVCTAPGGASGSFVLTNLCVGGGTLDGYSLLSSGPADLGFGAPLTSYPAISSTGDSLGLIAAATPPPGGSQFTIYLPDGYVTGSNISGSITIAGDFATNLVMVETTRTWQMADQFNNPLVPPSFITLTVPR